MSEYMILNYFTIAVYIESVNLLDLSDKAVKYILF